MGRKNRTKLITLDEETFEMSLQMANFSEWVRNKLRSERNQAPIHEEMKSLIKDLDLMSKQSDMWYHMLMKERGEEE